MAYHDTHHTSLGDTLKSVASGVGRFFAAIWHGLINAAEANQRLKAVERLQRKSDAELAALGLHREDIVHFVFRDTFYQ